SPTPPCFLYRRPRSGRARCGDWTSGTPSPRPWRGAPSPPRRRRYCGGKRPPARQAAAPQGRSAPATPVASLNPPGDERGILRLLVLAGLDQAREVGFGDVRRRSLGDDPSAAQQHRAVAELADQQRIVADHQRRMPGRTDLAVALLTPLLESRVAHGEHLVEHEYVTHRLKRHRVSEPRGHTTREILQTHPRI